jgi:preprotein translocase subunit YajC
MGVIPVTAALSAVIGAVTTIVTAWLRARSRERQERDRASRRMVRALPPGSRIVDLGRHGTIIDIGSRSSGSPRD